MLNGVDPILIITLKKRTPDTAGDSKIPLVSDIASLITLPSIPVYLSERITGILIDAEDQSIEVHTETNTLSDGSAPTLPQRGIQNTVNITMTAKRTSIGAALLSALMNVVFPKVTSGEYTITYLHGAITVFNGLLNSFGTAQNPDNDLYSITLSLIRPAPEAVKKTVEVEKITGALPVGIPAI